MNFIFSRRFNIFFGIILLIGGIILVGIGPKLNVFAQSGDVDCRGTRTYKEGTEITLKNPIGRHVSGVERAFDKNASSAASIHLDPKKKKSGAYIAAFLPKRMEITQVKIKWAIAPKGRSADRSGKGWNLYTGFGSKITSNSIYPCYMGHLSTIGLSADGTERTYNFGQGFKADYIVLTQAITTDTSPKDALIYELKVVAADPSSSPVKTVTKASTSGQVLLGGTQFPLRGVNIFDTTDQNVKTPIAETDSKGLFNKSGFLSGKRVFTAERNLLTGQTNKVELAPEPNKNKNDISMTVGSPNEITGFVTNLIGERFSGGGYVAAFPPGSSTYSDIGFIYPESGEYQLDELPHGQFLLKILTDPTDANSVIGQSDGPVIFDQDTGGSQKRDIKILKSPQPVSQKKHSFSVRVFETKFGVYEIKKLKDIDVSIEGQSGAAKGLRRQGKSDKVFTDMPYGEYKITAKAKGYRTIAGTEPIEQFAEISALDKEDHQYIDINVSREGQDKNCKQRPQPHIAEFWTCGVSDDYFKSKQASWSAIDNKVAALRTQTNIPDLPSQIVIQKTDTLNASYIVNSAVFSRAIKDEEAAPPLPGSDTCPPAFTGNFKLKDGERIVFATKMIDSVSPESIEQVSAHEFGHGVASRKAHCDGDISREDPFSGLRSLGKAYGDKFFTAVKDGTYLVDAPFAGHPDDFLAGNEETYASLFRLAQDPILPPKIDGLPDELKDLISYMLNVVKEPLK